MSDCDVIVIGSGAEQLLGSRGSQSPRSNSRIRLPDGASRRTSVPPPAADVFRTCRERRADSLRVGDHLLERLEAQAPATQPVDSG